MRILSHGIRSGSHHRVASSANFFVKDGGTGNGLSAGSPTEFLTAWNAATDGQTIKLVGNTTLPKAHIWTKTITITADAGAFDADPLGLSSGTISSRYTRPVKLIFQSPNNDNVTTNTHLSSMATGKSLTLQGGIKCVYERWPASSSVNWNTVGLPIGGVHPAFISGNDASNNLTLDGVEIFHGYGPSLAAYDPTAKLPEHNSPHPYWLDALNHYDCKTAPALTWAATTTYVAGNDVNKGGSAYHCTVGGTSGSTGPVGTGSGDIIDGTVTWRYAGSCAFPGWGDGTFTPRNNCLDAPMVIGGRFGALNIRNVYAHDINSFMQILIPGTGQIEVRDCWFERLNWDYLQMNIETGTALTGSIKVSRNVFLDPMGNSYDCGNPHVDFMQLYSTVEAGLTTSTPFRITNFESSNNFFGISRKGVRGQAQTHFLQASAKHEADTNFALMEAPKVRNNVALGATYKAFQADVARSPYIRDSIFLNPSWYDQAGVSAPFPAPTQPSNISLTKHFPTTGAIKLAVEDTKALISNVLSEGVSGNMSTLLNNSTNLGTKGATVAHTDVFADPSDPGATVLKPGEMFAKYKSIGAYASAGPQYSTLKAMLTDPLDFTGERPHISIIDLRNQVPATQITSNTFYIHGGDVGDTLSLTLPAGLEVQQYGSDRTTVVQAWSSSQTTLTVGQYAQIRATSPAAGAVNNYTIVVGGVNFSWQVISATTSVYPQVALSGDERWATNTNIALATTDTSYATIAYKMKWPAITNVSTLYFVPVTNVGGTQNAWIAVDDVGGKPRINGYDAAGTRIFAVTADGGSLWDGNIHEVMIAVDVTQTDPTLGVIISIDGAKRGQNFVTWNGGPDKAIGWTKSNVRAGIGNTAFFSSGFEFHYLWLDTTTALDVTSGVVSTLFAANQIGTNGEGPTGTSPALFVTGNAAQMNNTTTGVNFGSNSAKLFIQGGATVTDVVAGQAAWGAVVSPSADFSQTTNSQYIPLLIQDP